MSDLTTTASKADAADTSDGATVAGAVSGATHAGEAGIGATPATAARTDAGTIATASRAADRDDSIAPPLIRARGLTKRFGAFTAVDAIDIDVQPGEAVRVLRPNGAGKTSTMRMIRCVSAGNGRN